MPMPRCEFANEQCHQICAECFAKWDGERTIRRTNTIDDNDAARCCFCQSTKPKIFWVSLGRSAAAAIRKEQGMSTHETHDWISVNDALPSVGVIVETKIDDRDGCRNEQLLKRSGSLWFFPDGSMYVYYIPTHWRTR